MGGAFGGNKIYILWFIKLSCKLFGKDVDLLKKKHYYYLWT